jgi:hypothetical protein
MNSECTGLSRFSFKHEHCVTRQRPETGQDAVNDDDDDDDDDDNVIRNVSKHVTRYHVTGHTGNGARQGRKRR